MDSPQLIQTLVNSFNALADEVQSLVDRKTILEHKLRFAHEQYQHLADKYAPAAPDISETLAKLQLPPEIRNPSLTNTAHVPVPLPNRHQSDSSQAELAIFIREGKKVAQQLSALADASKGSGSSRETLSTNMTSMSTALEQDFTIQGKKGQLRCPFSAVREDKDGENAAGSSASHVQDPTPHQSGDPICAAMYEETMSAPAPSGAASKCPIRYLDKHSPEEIAHYVETHKHDLPRSHEVCLRRNQKTVEQIRKLDAKYGNIVSMIQDLSHLHAPMLPAAEPETKTDVDGASNRRVKDWAQDVSASVAGSPDSLGDEDSEENEDENLDDRSSRFDRPLKEVRVGESPSRPWGISLPVYDDARSNPSEADARPVSPPAPVRMPSPEQTPKMPAALSLKCPFDHSKLRTGLDGPGLSEFPKMEDPTSSPQADHEKQATSQNFTPLRQPLPPDSPPASHQPALLNGAGPSKEGGHGGPSMVFTGPVFIGYPMEQAIQFMQHFQNQP